jgi:hypothetical protein
MADGWLEKEKFYVTWLLKINHQNYESFNMEV